MNWQAQKEDFGDGWVKELLAQSHPHSLQVFVNIFTNEVNFRVIDLDGKLPTRNYNNFDKALNEFNERLI